MASRSKKDESRKKDDPNGQKKKKTGWDRAKAIAREIVFLSVLVVAVLSARASLADHYYVPSGSMLPTVEEGDHLVVNKLAFGLRVPRTNHYLFRRSAPERGEVVVLTSPYDRTILLKRIVAIPGDQILVDAHGRLFLDGKLVESVKEEDGTYEMLGNSPHTVRFTSRRMPPYGPMKVSEDLYLVLGDNRGESQDGRNFGLVHRDAILGRAVAIYWRGGPTWLKFH